MSDIRIVAAMIVGDESTRLEQALESLEGQVDLVALVYNGAERDARDAYPFLRRPPVPTAYTSVPVDRDPSGLPHWETFDFSEQRMKSFEFAERLYRSAFWKHIESPTDDVWLFWQDSDDLLEGDLRAAAAAQPDNVGCVFFRYDYAFHEEGGHKAMEQWRERLFRVGIPWQWTKPVHETCDGPWGVRFERSDLAAVVHQRKAFATGDPVSRDRNRRIIEAWGEREPHNVRVAYYLANELFAQGHQQLLDGKAEWHANLQRAKELYRRFIAVHGNSDDGYIANHRVAECFRFQREHNLALDAELQGIKIRVSWAESYLGMASSLMELGRHGLARDWADACIKNCSIPETHQVTEPLSYTYTPWVYRGLAQEKLGELQPALDDLLYAQSVANPSGLQGHIDRVQAAIAEAKAPATLAAKQALRRLSGTRLERSIAFYTRQGLEAWTADSIASKGSGGAEHCVTELARRFAADDWRVVVFGTPEGERVDEHGVEWRSSEAYDPHEAFRVVVASRAPEAFDAPAPDGQTRLLWMHDVHIGPDVQEGPWGDRFLRADRVVALSAWHARHLRRLYGIPESRLAIVGNGYDDTLFGVPPPASEAERHGRLVFASSPDRGLDTLLGLWPAIRARLPQAELHVYYGWDMIDAVIRNHPGTWLFGFKAKIARRIDELGRESGGIFWHGRQPRAQLAADLVGIDAWAYCTTFAETFCCTALETQASGVIPVTSRVGALPEVVDDAFSIQGYANSHTFQRQWLDALFAAVEAPEAEKVLTRARLAAGARRHTWDHAYESWQALLGEPVARTVIGVGGVAA